MFDLSNRYDFLKAAILFEGSLIGLASALGWWLGIDPLARFAWNSQGWLGGVTAVVPMFAVFVVAYRSPLAPLRRIRRFLEEVLGPSMIACRWYHLALVALVAGVGEEVLFRGVLQPRLGLLGSNLLFGLAHFITPAYALTAALIGMFLGWLLDASGNLLAPVVAHGVYDFLAFLVVAREIRKGRAGSGSEDWERQSRK